MEISEAFKVPIAGCRSKKSVFLSRAEVVVAIRRTGGAHSQLTPYLCRECGFWHMTGGSPSSRRLRRGERRLGRR